MIHGLLIGVALALSPVATVKIPGGVLEVPAGCRAPPEIPMLIDAFIGEIACNRGKTKIVVLGPPLGHGLCSLRPNATFKSRFGATVRVCSGERVDGVLKRRVEVLIADVGMAQLEVEVLGSRDALLLLQVASSFRPDREQ